jgi:hypothetical protein
MKSFFRKSIISMFVMGLAGTSVVSHAGAQSNSAMWSPHFTGWFIGVDGLYLRPENGDLDYVTLFPASAFSGGSFQTQNISTDYKWSWRFYGGIKFTDNDDLTFSWLRMRASDNDSVGVPVDNSSQPRWQDTQTWDNVSGDVDFDLDEIYLVWGHTINFNNPWTVRYAAGVEYAKLNSDFTITGQDISNGFDGTGFVADSHTRGFGPRFEFDMTYHLPCNFALFGNANAALLVSTRKISQVAIEGSDEDRDLNSSYFSTRHVVIPKFGARLGASYTYIFGQSGGEGACLSALTIDAGWQFDSYIHAIERPESTGFSTDTLTALSSGTFADTKTSNFGDQGFFIGLKYSSGAL